MAPRCSSSSSSTSSFTHSSVGVGNGILHFGLGLIIDPDLKSVAGHPAEVIRKMGSGRSQGPRRNWIVVWRTKPQTTQSDIEEGEGQVGTRSHKDFHTWTISLRSPLESKSLTEPTGVFFWITPSPKHLTRASCPHVFTIPVIVSP